LPARTQYGGTNPSYSTGASVLTFGSLLPNGGIEPARTFQPFWSN
jgi:hypothetical protein